MANEDDVIDEIRYVGGQAGQTCSDKSLPFRRNRPVVKAAKKLGVIGQVAATLGLQDEELEALERSLQGMELSAKRRRDHLLVKVSSASFLEVTPGSIAVSGARDDATIEAAVSMAKRAWAGPVTVYGPEDFKLRTWAHALVAGLELEGYTPPPEKHAQAYQEVLRLMHTNMQKHGIKELSPLQNGYELALAGVIDKEEYFAAGKTSNEASARIDREGLVARLKKAEQTARWLPLTDPSKLIAAGIIDIDDAPRPARAVARTQPKGP